MTKRPPGTGTVRTLRAPTEDQPGRYQALGPRLPNGRRVSLYCGTDRAEAERWANEGARQLADGTALHLTGTTLRGWLDRYLDGREHDAPRSVKAERKAAKHILAAPWIDDPIDTIRTPAIQAHLVALARRLPGMARSAKALLSGAMGAAARDGLVDGNPVASVKLPRQVRTHEPWTYLLPEEQARLLAAPILEADRLLVVTWLYTGMRAGEILSLRLADLHLERAELVIRHGSLHGPTKGRRVRTLHVPPPAVAALTRWLTLLPAYLDGHANQHGLVFPGRRGGARDVGHPFRRDEMLDGKRVHVDGWSTILDAAGIVASERHDGLRPRPHDAFRHTCGASLASGWWGEPWSLAEIQAHLGHATVRQTERYAHLAPSVVRAKASRVGYALVTTGRDPSGKTSQTRALHLVRGSSPGAPTLPEDLARHAPSVTQERARAALEQVDAALDACAEQDPHAGRKAVEALGVARGVLADVVADAERGEAGERVG